MDFLSGVFCALWTPTDRDGVVLWSALDEHLSFVLDHGTTGLMALGSTAEFVHFSPQEREVLLEHLVTACKKRGRRVIANISDVTFRNVVKLARCAERLGVDCVALLPPWYFPLDQRDLTEFFIEAARATQTPFALYNFPEVTGKTIELATIEAVAREVRVAAVKQSGGEFEGHKDLLKLGAKLGFKVLTGWDTRLPEALRLGCSGTISGLANAIPDVLNRIYQRQGQKDGADRDIQLVERLAAEIGALKFPLNIKAAIAARGFETGALKMPVSPKTLEEYEVLRAKIEKLFVEFQLPSRTRS